MSIQTAYLPNSYNGDGIVSTFPVTFPFQFSTDLIVQQIVVLTGVVTTLVLGTGYTVIVPFGLLAGTGTVVLVAGALPVGSKLLISRSVPATQLTHLVPNDPVPSTAIESAFDKLTMLFQQNLYNFGRTWFLRPFDVDGSGAFDARNNRGTNLANPIASSDAVNLGYMSNYVTQLITTGVASTPADFEYTGDASTTTFAITGSTVPNATGYYVTLDGLLQRPTVDYTVVVGASPAIIFTSAPPNLVKVGIRVLGFAQPILSGINGSAINSGYILPIYLGTGANSVSNWLRGDGTWSNVLIGSGGAEVASSSSQIVADFQNNQYAAIRVSGGSTGTAGYFFGVGGSAKSYEAAWIYNPQVGAIYNATSISSGLSAFYNNGDVAFGGFGLVYRAGLGRVGINQSNPAYALDVNGTVNGNYVGTASGSLITSGQVLPQFLASNTPSSGLFLRGDGLWSIPPSGGGGGGSTTTTTATFTIVAVASSQAVAVTASTGFAVGNYVAIGDGTRSIIGHITTLAGLNWTVVTDNITAGAAGQTMLSGAAIQLSLVPGQFSIIVQDALTSPTPVTALNFSGSQTGGGLATNNFVLYLSSFVGSTATIKAYAPNGISANKLDTIGGSSDALPAWRYGSGPTGTLYSNIDGGVLTQDGLLGSGGGLAFRLLVTKNFAFNSIIPGLLNSTNSPLDGYAPVYDAASGFFRWAASGSGGLPVGGTTGLFLRGDSTYSNVLDVSVGPAAGKGLYISQGTANGSMALRIISNAANANFFINQLSSGVWIGSSNNTYTFGNNGTTAGYGSTTLVSGDSWSNPDSGIKESGYFAGILRALSYRSLSGIWANYTTLNAPAASITLDMALGAYYRLTGLTNNVSITLADNVPVPVVAPNFSAAPFAGVNFSGEMTVEITAPGSFTVTWPATVTWAGGGSAPTLSTTGVNVARLLRRQGQTQWIGIVENGSVGSGYSDLNARAAVLNTTYLQDSAQLAWTVSPGVNAALALKPSAINATNLFSNAVVPIAALSASGTPSVTTFLRGDNTWAVPAGTGGGGQTAIQFQNQGSSIGGLGAINTLNFTGAGVSAVAFGPNLTVNIAGGGGGVTYQKRPNPTAAPVAFGTTPTTLVFGKGIVVTEVGATSTITVTNGLFNVVDYGADPLGVADSTAAFNAAYLAAGTTVANGGTLRIPAGNYKINAGLTFGSNVNIVGDGCWTGTFGTINNSTITYTGASPITMMKFPSLMNGIKIRGFTLDGGAAALVGMEINNAQGCVFEDISVRNPLNSNSSIGIYLNVTSVLINGNYFNRVVSQTSSYGQTTANTGGIAWKLWTSIAGQADVTGNTFNDCYAEHSYIGFLIGFADGNIFNHCGGFHSLPAGYRLNNAYDLNYDMIMDSQDSLPGFCGENFFYYWGGSIRALASSQAFNGPKATMYHNDFGDGTWAPRVDGNIASYSWIRTVATNINWNGTGNVFPGIPHMNSFDMTIYGPGIVTTESTLNGVLPSAPGLYFASGWDMKSSGGPYQVVVSPASGGVPFAPKKLGSAVISGFNVVTYN